MDKDTIEKIETLEVGIDLWLDRQGTDKPYGVCLLCKNNLRIDYDGLTKLESIDKAIEILNEMKKVELNTDKG